MPTKTQPAIATMPRNTRIDRERGTGTDVPLRALPQPKAECHRDIPRGHRGDIRDKGDIGATEWEPDRPLPVAEHAAS